MNFLLPQTTIEMKKEVKEVGGPDPCIYSRPHFRINEYDFYLDVKNVARYRVQNGQQVSICPYEGVDQESIELFLEGSALGAVLHQRGMLPFHGSSFAYRGKGVLVCGHSGVGKSSVTAAFCRQDAVFINDDISPVSISDSNTMILPLKTRIKLWDDSLRTFEIDSEPLQRIRPGMDKFYLPVEDRATSGHPLDYIFILCTHQKDEFQATELDGMGKYNALRRQVYRRVYLRGMPETEKTYFRQLFALAAKVRVIRITRPRICDIRETRRFIEQEMAS